MKNKKVIVIGLDGATWDLIKPWVDDGKLPNFRYLMKTGAWGILESTIPPLSPSAWTSIYTGCMPSKHGIFGFINRKADSYFYHPISSKDVNKPAIWETLSDYGKRSIIVNALFSYPPKPINGIIVTGLGTPSKESDFVYPKPYKEFILKNFPKYDVDFNEDLLLVTNDADGFIGKIEEVTREQIKLTKYLLENEKWDFMFSIFRALDVIQHYYWENKDLIFRFYKIYDDFIGELLKSSFNDEQYNLFIVSDHGFSSVKTYFCINNWLEQIGLLKTSRSSEGHVITAETIKKLFLKLGMRDFVWIIKRSAILEKMLKIIPSEEFSYVNNIMWNETKAYYYEGSDGIICINLKNREPNGIVSKEKSEEITDFIINELKKIEHIETKEKIVKNVFTKGQLFGTSDIYVPDIYISLEKGYRAIGHNKINNSIFMPPIHGKSFRPGDHSTEGIFIAHGSRVNKGLHIKDEIKLWDVLPTILYTFKLPYNNVDGRIISEVFVSVEDIGFSHNVPLIKERENLKDKIRTLKQIKKI